LCFLFQEDKDLPKERLTLEDKLYLVKFKPDEESHLVIKDAKVCADCCKGKPGACTNFCPAGVYKFDEGNNAIIVNYEECFECGSCRISCPFGNIEWRYPRGGFGVQYRYG
jgi:ferredoxin like protein